MRAIWKTFIPKRFSIRTKAILIFALILPLFILLLGFVIQIWMYQYATELVMNTKLKTDVSVAGEISTLRQRDESLSNQLLLNERLVAALSDSPPQTDLSGYLQYKDIKSALSGMIDKETVLGIYVHGINGMNFRSDDTVANLFHSDPARFSDYQDLAKSDTGRNLWCAKVGNDFEIHTVQSPPPAPSLYLTREIRSANGRTLPVGLSVIQVNYQGYVSALLRAVDNPGEYSCIVDKKGTVLVQTAGEGIGEPFPQDLFDQTLPNSTGHTITKDQNGMLLYVGSPGSGGWTIIHYIPTQIIRDTLAPIGKFIWGVMLLSSLLLTSALTVFTSSIINPITRLKTTMNRFGRGHMSIRLRSLRKDEIGDLERKFDDMADEIENYLKEREKQNGERLKLECKVLENQINPHFLYNTLDLINWRSRLAHQNDITEMTALLAQFYRIGLHEGRDRTTVEKEIEHAGIYLSICRIRYGGAFTYEVNCPEELKSAMIQKLILQPILENAVAHGLKGSSHEGSIRLWVERIGEKLLFHVADNGQGMTNSRLQEIRDLLSREEIDGRDAFGLQNINRRIVLEYGKGYGVSVESDLESGTHVTVRVKDSKV